MASDRHSRLVALLKVAFPIMALGLLSTLFLLSRGNDPDAAIPFADKEVQDRLRDQQVTGPFFSGTTASGDQISFSAERLTTPSGQAGTNRAETVTAKLSPAEGAEIRIDAKRADFDLPGDRADLTGDVVISTSNGYRLSSELLTSELSTLRIVSPGPVEGTAPGGTLKAGTMTLEKNDTTDGAQMNFTRGVKLVYTPKQEVE